MSEADEETKKKIDESWKEAVEREGTASSEGEGCMPSPKADFSFFISSLAMEALIALGEMENPITKKKSVDLQKAQYLIDTIDMLKEKSKGNLTEYEDVLVANILPDLKMRYVGKVK